MSTILVSRFMLAIREKAVNPNDSASHQLPDMSSLHIVVNNLHSVIDQDLEELSFTCTTRGDRLGVPRR